MKLNTPIKVRIKISPADLRKLDLMKSLTRTGGGPIAVLNQGKPIAYLMLARDYKRILNLLGVQKIEGLL